MSYAYSTDEEHYTEIDGTTYEEAAANAFAEVEENVIFIGENYTPIPEEHLDAADILDQICQVDDFSGEWAEGWPGETKEQREDLEAMLRPVFAAWLDKHGLRPGFFNVENAREFRREATP